uniref:Uncharacterized protein n=1 Tax=Anguilla anguilla TaxID=7936 RepID=A0A0E9WY17_ANGAN
MFGGRIVGGRIMWSIALLEKSVAYLHGVNSGKLFLGRITYHHHERRDDTNFTKHFTLGPKKHLQRHETSQIPTESHFCESCTELYVKREGVIAVICLVIYKYIQWGKHSTFSKSCKVFFHLFALSLFLIYDFRGNCSPRILLLLSVTLSWYIKLRF